MWRDVEDGSIPRTQSEELSNPAGKSAPRDVSRLNGRAVHRSPFKPLRVGYDPHPRHPLPRTTATVGRALRDRIANSAPLRRNEGAVRSRAPVLWHARNESPSARMDAE